MNNKKAGCLVQTIAGAVLAAVGLLIFPKEGMWAQFGICIGFGTAFFTLGLSGLVYLLRVPPGERRKTEEQKKIEVNDERNVRIREKTGSMVAKVMTYVLCIFLLVLTLMGADKGIVLMAAGLLAAQLVLAAAFSGYYFKRM